MRGRIGGVSRLLAVASGKGGVGKTTVTVNLALALALGGASVGIFDADIHGPNVPLALGIGGLAPEQSKGIYMTLGRAPGEPTIPPIQRFGLRVMSLGLLLADSDPVMASGSIGLLAVQTLRDVRWGRLDYLLIDLPPGTGEPQQSLLGAFELDGVVLVSTPQAMSLLDTRRSLGLFRSAGAPVLGVVENMSYLTCPHCGEEIEVFHRSGRRIEGDSEPPGLLGRVPLRLAISRGIDADHPLVNGSSAAPEASAFVEIAARVADALERG